MRGKLFSFCFEDVLFFFYFLIILQIKENQMKENLKLER